MSIEVIKMKLDFLKVGFSWKSLVGHSFDAYEDDLRQV